MANLTAGLRRFAFLCLLAQQAAAGSTLDPGAYASLGIFNPSGNLTISTNGGTPTIKDSSNTTLFTGVNNAGIAVFDFSSINLTAGITVNVTGTSPLALLTAGSANIAGTINIAAGNIGGPGAGSAPPFQLAGGGGFGGAGGGGFFGGGAGPAYGNLLNVLQGGSSGASVPSAGPAGGAGGGAIGIVSLNILNVSGSIQANGGNGSTDSKGQVGSGGGSGGGILLNGTTVNLSGTLQASGGAGGSGLTGGGGGGGGRIAIETPSLIVAPSALSVAGAPGGSSGNQGNVAYTGVIVPAGQSFQLVNGLTSDAGGVITLQSGSGSGGILTTLGGYTNMAEIDLQGANTHIQGDALTNAGQIRGTGQVDATLLNAGGGQINILSKDQMTLTGVGGDNSGLITVTGGTLKVSQAFTNEISGTLDAMNATLSFNGVFTNAGNLNFSTGNSNVLGNIDNSEGIITVSGGGSVTFQGNVNSDTEFQVLKSGTVASTVTIRGNLTGAGGTSGRGTVFLDGALEIGTDPDSVAFGGDLFFGGSAQYDAVLGGTAQGSYDMVSVAGELGLAGTLDVSLFTGFHPKALDVFDILNWGSLSGTFTKVELPPLDSGLRWNLANLYTNGQISVQSQTPEPGSCVLLGIGAMGMFWRIRRRARAEVI